MKRQRVVAATALLAMLVAGVVLVHSRQHRATRSTAHLTAPSAANRIGAAKQASPATVQHPSAFTHAMVTADPAGSARAWTARSDAAVTAKYEKQFDERTAQLLTLPPSDAWSALTERARNGDSTAAKAALLLAIECMHLPQQVAVMRAQGSRAMDHWTSGLPAGWEPFLRAIDVQYHERLEARAASCAGVDGTWDFALTALDRFMRPDDPETQLAAANDTDDDDTAIADLRGLAGGSDNANARRMLGQRLMQSRDPGAQSEGRALLQQLAAADPDIVGFLAMCFRNGCGFFRGDRSVADAWVERAAGLGESWALDTRIADLQAAAQTIDAWAWALYRLDLAAAGCFEEQLPQPVWIAQSAEAAFRLESALSAAQRAQGRAIAATIAARWETTATARLGCSA